MKFQKAVADLFRAAIGCPVQERHQLREQAHLIVLIDPLAIVRCLHIPSKISK
jgi:hypothetical protein